MKILVINAGSSSLKYQLFDMETETMLAKGNCEKIKLEDSFIEYKAHGQKEKEYIYFPDHKVALENVIRVLTSGKLKVIDSLKDISAFGHRVVHGKDYTEPTLVDEKVIAYLEENMEYAPLHLPGAITGFKACKEIAPEIPNVAVFDTAFHSSMSDAAKTYAIPHEYAEKYGIRRYGAHGTSHKFINSEVERVTGKKGLRVISCHIGSGASLCAIKDGKCVDTSMGFTPLAGVVMGTRSGDVDPSIIGFLSKKLNLDASEIINILNNKSGLLGLCGKSDSRNVDEGVEANDPLFLKTFEVMNLSILKYIGAYIVELGGVDVIAFTAGIGENSPLTRADILDKLAFMGIKYDKELNKATIKKPNPVKISTEDSTVDVYVIPTNEELVIARETLEKVSK